MSYPYARSKVGVVGASAVTVDLSGRGKEVLLSSTTDCWISFTGTAVANTDFYLPADTPTRIKILYAPSLSVIQDTAGGFLSALEYGDVTLIQTIRGFFTSNANLKSTEATSWTSNSNLLREDISDTASGDSNLLRENISDTMTADASLLVVLSNTITADANLLRVAASTATSDSNLVGTLEATVTGDSALITP